MIQLAIFVYVDRFERSLTMVYSKGNFSFFLKREDYGWFGAQFLFLFHEMYQFACFPVVTGRKLNAHKPFRRRPGRYLNLLCTFNLHPVSTGLNLNCSNVYHNFIRKYLTQINLFLLIFMTGFFISVKPYFHVKRWALNFKSISFRHLINFSNFANNFQYIFIDYCFGVAFAAQKMKFPIKNFFSKYDQIRRKLHIYCTWSHLLKKSLMENLIFCAVPYNCIGGR